MNSQNLKDLIDYVMEHNSWKKCSAMENRKMPKYLDFKLWFTLDTRDGIIFYLKTRQSGKDKSYYGGEMIDFDKKNKRFRLTRKSCQGNTHFKYGTLEELQAINQQINELGWE